jgi:hypothetical protein
MWYWWLAYRNFRSHPKGIANYADKAASIVAADGLAGLLRAQARISSLLIASRASARLIQQKWNKLRDLGAPNAPFVSPVTPEQYEDIRLRVHREWWVWLGLVAGEGFLNYLALLIIITSNEPLLVVARVVIALILTIVAFKVFHYAMEAWQPQQDQESHGWQGRLATATLGIVMLVAIAGISVARAHDFEGGAEGGIGFVGLGFILVSLILPVVGGYVDLERGRVRPVFRRLTKWRAALKDLRRLEADVQRKLTQIDEQLDHVTTELHEKAHRMYAGVTNFRVSKDLRDAKRGNGAEDLTHTMAKDRASFLAACAEPYETRKTKYMAALNVEKAEIMALAKRNIESQAPRAADVPSTSVPPAVALLESSE